MGGKLDSDHPSDQINPSHNQKSNLFPLWTVKDVAHYLRLSTETVRSMARDGKLPAVKIGKSWRFQPEKIQAVAKNNIE